MNNVEFDYVVVGAGSAGCAVAARLTERRELRVLLLEAGGADSNIWIHIPLGLGKLLHNPKFVWPFTTEPEPGLLSKKLYWPRGRVLGGSSSTNGMTYVRGDPKEFDNWKALGNTGWGYEDVLPYFKRLENYPRGDPIYRGNNGPIRITSRGSWDPDPLSDAFIAACCQAGIAETDDYNGKTFEGVSYLQQNIFRGRRCSSAVAYLKDAGRRENLRIQLNAYVRRIIFQGTRASEVHYDLGNEHHVARIRGEVVLCAGALKSPHLLELSGVGNAELLNRLGIPVVKQLPGVGEGLCDHAQVRLTYECSKPLTVNDVINNPVRRYFQGLRYVISRRGLLSMIGSTAQAVLKTDSRLAQPDLKIQLTLLSGRDRYSRSKSMGVDPFSGFQIGMFKLRPDSRGSVHAQSGDPYAQPAMRANYLTQASDIEVYLKGFRVIRNVAQQKALAPFIVAERRPGASVIADEELVQYARETAQTAWHGISTCRMGSDEFAVVDARLRVHGLQKVRVADISVMPTMASSNTNASAIMIGERAADFLLSNDS